VAVLLPLGYYLYQTQLVRPRADREREFQVLTGAILRHVRAEENAAGPPPASLTLESPGMSEETGLLKAGAASFGRGDYPASRDSFTRLHALKPSRETLALLAAANLRESNFSLAREHFQELVAPPFPDPDLASSVGLGLSLALFNLVDLEGALPHAESAYGGRLARLGPASRETASAGNILSAILIGLGRAQEAEAILEKTVRSSLEDGKLAPVAPVVADALNLLALSYGMGDSGKDVFDLLPPELRELAGPGRPQGRGPGGDGSAAPASRGEPGPEGSGRPVDGTRTPTAGGGRDPREAGAGSADAGAAPDASGRESGDGHPADRTGYAEMLSVYNAISRDNPRSPLRAELLAAMASELIPGRNGGPCADPGASQARESLWNLCVSLADALVSDGEFDRGFGVTGELLNWPEAQTGPQRHRLFRNAAFQNSRQGALAGAEEFLRLALAAAAADDPETADVPFMITRAVTLADTLLRQGKARLEAEIELTATVTLLERRLSRRVLDTYPESPFLYWYLARVLRGQGRNGDARSFFDRAARASASAADAHPEMKPELSHLGDLIRADRNWRRGRRNAEPPAYPQSPRIFFDAEARYAVRERRPPSPSAMRLDLQGWKLLGRIREFEPMIDRALESLEPGTPEYLRYQSLRLKYLEETRDWPRLFGELESMTADPPLEDPRARALFLSSARSYEARMRIASGDPGGAVGAYEEAAAVLAGVPDTDAAKADIASELSRLRAELAPASGDTPAAGAAQDLPSGLAGQSPSPESGDVGGSPSQESGAD
jgi:tetratricopeptide (TPR) repeat protein